MNSPTALPANSAAERIVRHFQSAGFAGITEALVVRIGLKKGDRMEIEAAFGKAADQGAMPPLAEYFTIQPYGFYSEQRGFAQAKAEIQSDFGVNLRRKLPAVYFDRAPVVADDALATGTRYDALVKLSDNILDYALAVLLNDPASSFFEYMGAQRGNDWQKIIGDFESTAGAFEADLNLI